MKQVYTVRKLGMIYLYNRGAEVYCPYAGHLNHCGDRCSLFDFTPSETVNEGPYQHDQEASVTLHCCGRFIPVEVVE